MGSNTPRSAEANTCLGCGEVVDLLCACSACIDCCEFCDDDDDGELFDSEEE